VQIEYALNAVAAGASTVGIKGELFAKKKLSHPINIISALASNGIVFATENKHKSLLYDENSVHKIENITDNIGMVYSGMGPDYRLLVRQARKIAQNYYMIYNESIPTSQLVQVRTEFIV
jgi:20S proteasome subunit alpha 2